MTLNRWTACGIVLVSFVAGSLITARLTEIVINRKPSNILHSTLGAEQASRPRCFRAFCSSGSTRERI
jgi:hypothetical protein